ncbi:MAG: AraC family transcriptional regulator [Pseudomonadota bacterium]
MTAAGANPDLMAVMGETGSGDAEGSDPAILASAATGVVDFLEKFGGDVDLVFGRTGIAPELAGTPTLKLRLDAFCRLFEEAARQTGNDNFGLWFGNQFAPRDLGLWGYASISSPTLGSALENLVSLFDLHQESSMMAARRRDNGLVSLEYQIVSPEIVERRQDAELSLGMFLNVIRECCGPHWAPEEVYFEHAKPADWHAHEAAFQAPVYFSQPVNALLFRDDVLNLPMPGRDPTLMTMMRSCLDRLSQGSTKPVTLVDQIGSFIRNSLPGGYPSLKAVSDELKISQAVIQRELAREGLVYKDMVEATRRDLTHMYLKQRQLPFSEISLLLGYSELSAFSRAVRRWTGHSPRDLRQKLCRHN